LTLKGVSPTTLFFSDRPVRIAGHFHTKQEFLPLWVEGKDSFLKELKSLLNQGLITQSQYQEESQKILNQLAG
jgi:hypothetical protein